MSQLEVLISKLFAIDGFSASSVSSSEVTTLTHEVGNDTVEGGSFVAEPLLSSAQSTEILSGFGNHIGSQL